MLRTHASFRGRFPKDQNGIEPPGKLIADLISDRLAIAGYHVDRRDSTEYSHTFDIIADKRCFAATVGMVDDGDREWLFFANSTLGWLSRLFGQKDDATHRQVLRAVGGILANDPRISELRWYTEKEWNRNPEGGSKEGP